VQLTALTTPPRGALIGNSIFIASSTITVSPSLTVLPGAVVMATTVAGIGAITEESPRDFALRPPLSSASSIRHTLPSRKIQVAVASRATATRT